MSSENKSFEGAFKNHPLTDGTSLSYGAAGKETSFMRKRFLMIEQPSPGNWVTLDTHGSMDCSDKADFRLFYGLWHHPNGADYEEQFEKAGGAAFYKKTANILLADASGQWFISDSSIELKRTPKKFNGDVALNLLDVAWQAVRLEDKGPIKLNKPIQPDLSQVTSIGIAFEESNPLSQVQIKSIGLQGGASPSVYVSTRRRSTSTIGGLRARRFFLLARSEFR